MSMRERKRLAVWTGGRADYGILRSTLQCLREDPRFDLRLWAGGTHFSPAHGHTIDLVIADGSVPSFRIDSLRSGDSPADVLSETTRGVSAAIDADAPDAVLVLGDRYETLGVATLCAARGVPLVHLHGGEETEGAIDNACRHAISKLAVLHLTSHPDHAARLLQMGEDPDSVFVVGAPGLDNLHRSDLPRRGELSEALGIPLEPPVVIVTMHPTTLTREATTDAAFEARSVAAAMDEISATYVITQPNADPGSAEIRDFWLEHSVSRPRTVLVSALGETRFWGMLRVADAVLGNSSAGIIEAPAAGLPVVNVGDRQAGRVRSEHVTTVPPIAAEIASALRTALDPGTRERLARVDAVYDRRPAAPRIVEILARWEAPSPPRKRFVSRP